MEISAQLFPVSNYVCDLYWGRITAMTMMMKLLSPMSDDPSTLSGMSGSSDERQWQSLITMLSNNWDEREVRGGWRRGCSHTDSPSVVEHWSRYLMLTTLAAPVGLSWDTGEREWCQSNNLIQGCNNHRTLITTPSPTS